MEHVTDICFLVKDEQVRRAGNEAGHCFLFFYPHKIWIYSSGQPSLFDSSSDFFTSFSYAPRQTFEFALFFFDGTTHRLWINSTHFEDVCLLLPDTPYTESVSYPWEEVCKEDVMTVDGQEGQLLALVMSRRPFHFLRGGHTQGDKYGREPSDRQNP